MLLLFINYSTVVSLILIGNSMPGITRLTRVSNIIYWQYSFGLFILGILKKDILYYYNIGSYILYRYIAIIWYITILCSTLHMAVTNASACSRDSVYFDIYYVTHREHRELNVPGEWNSLFNIVS